MFLLACENKPTGGVDLAAADLAAADSRAGAPDLAADLAMGSSIYSCDVRTAPMPQQYCQEYAGLSSPGLVAAYMGACTGMWAMAPCSKGGSLGACRGAPAMGITITNWFFPGSYPNADAVKTGCMASGATYVPP